MDSTFLVFLPFFFFYLFFLNSLRCPQCGTKSSPQVSSTWEQWLEGFYTCRQCGADVFANGQLRTAPLTARQIRARWMPALVLTVFGLVVMPAISMWSLHRIRTQVLVVSPPAPPVTPAPAVSPPATRPLGPITVDPLTGRAIAPVPHGMTQAEFDRLTTPSVRQ